MRKNSSSKLEFLALGAGAGASLMYALDPISGRRRRAVAADKMRHASAVAKRSAPKMVADLSGRLKGIVSESAQLFQGQTSDDEIVTERVRSRVGRLVSHPSAIDVSTSEGTVTLSGPILSDEANDLLRYTAKVRGVKAVTNQLDLHERAENVSALQGGKQRLHRPELLQDNWSPTARWGIGALGALVTASGLRQKGVAGLLFGTAGIGLLARAISNLPFRRLTGMGAGRRAVTITKTVHINAPVEEVYNFCSQLNHFPFLLKHVEEVNLSDNNISHWRVRGPFGLPFEWEAEIVEALPNRTLAWQTSERSSVWHAGIIRFDAEDSGTRLHLQMHYNPPGGALGHALARLLGSDPKSKLDEDLVRIKALLESGKPARDASKETA